MRQTAMGLHNHLLNTSICAVEAACNLADACEARRVGHRWRVGSMRCNHFLNRFCPFDIKVKLISMLSVYCEGTALHGCTDTNI